MNALEIRDEPDWETVHDSIYKLLCSIHTTEEIKRSIENLFEEFLHTKSNNSIYEYFQRQYLTLMEINPYQRYSIIQFVVLLDLNFISERILITLSNSNLDCVNWSHILKLISVMSTCIKGGVTTVKFIIHQLLLLLFHSSINHANNKQIDLDNLHLLDDLFMPTTQSVLSAIDKHDQQLLIAILLIARQLCSEDYRLTGINYKQWWLETFCTPFSSSTSTIRNTDQHHQSHNSSSAPFVQNIISSRCTVVYFCNLLIDLLPFERNVKFLQIQLNTQPNWFSLMKKSTNNRIKTHINEIHIKATEDEILEMDLDYTNNIIHDDNDNKNNNHDNLEMYIESCISRWNDYCEIAQGRLAELREHCCTTKVMLIDKSASDYDNTCTTPGWSDVLSWLNEIAIQNSVRSGNDDIDKCRLPSEWNEVNLFRPRWLRSTLIPALMNAPEIEHLSTELKCAREQLLQGIRSAGLSHLINHTEVKLTNMKSMKRTATGTKKQSTSSSSFKSKQHKVLNKTNSKIKQTKIDENTIT
ncbi:unnamed protein product [Schistosoma turkestanicum]|nr:unnamed protein product [Schistosoma turkestanicum]